MSPDPEKVAALLRRAADEVILPRFRRLAAHEIREKGPGNLVTIADTEAEHLLAPALLALVPGSRVVGEEATSADPTVLQRLDTSGAVWVIDPVDGTMNFTKGDADFAVIVAYVEDGSVRAGWIHEPVEGTTVWAARGEGAWRDGNKLSLQPAPSLDAMIGMVAGRVPSGKRARTILENGEAGRLASDIRCAGRTYTRLVDNVCHYAFVGRSLPWDHAAGWLIHREAGGYGAFLDGSAYTPARHDHPLLFAPDADIWDHLRAVLTAA